MDGPQGPYKLRIGIAEQRLVLAVTVGEVQEPAAAFLLSLKPFRKVVKDYFLVCENYFEAIKSAPPGRIEALDMGPRALHDEGSKLLMERLDGKGPGGCAHVAAPLHAPLRVALERLARLARGHRHGGRGDPADHCSIAFIQRACASSPRATVQYLPALS